MILWCDSPRNFQWEFQESGTNLMESIVDLHSYIMIYIIIAMVGIIGVIGRIIMDRNEFSLKYELEGSELEFVWTIIPAIILMAIAIPSFKLLYKMDEILDPDLTLKVIGHQWYWEFEYGNNISLESYMIPTEELEDGRFRMLEVDNRIVLPIDKKVRVIGTSVDVIHSWAVPSLGIKMDTIPGRLNQVGLEINREGVYYGQCSELCGVGHQAMPIVVEGVYLDKYISWLSQQ